jgi:O-antigen/teichoic acid export membrane protein
MQFVVAVILARLLAPADFGLIALLTFFTALAMVFLQGGLTTALVQRADTTIEEQSAVFWFNLGASVIFGAALLMAAGMLARFYGQPLIQSLIGVAAAQIVVSALGAVHAALLARDLHFLQLAKVGVISSSLSGGAGVWAAMSGLGIWALAIQMLVAAASSTGALWWASRWRPIAHFRVTTLRRLFGFGAWLGVSSLLDVFYTQGFALLLGKLYGLRELGLYNRAASTQQLPANVLAVLIARVALPLFATKVTDTAAVRRGMRLAVALAMLGNVPAMVGLAILSDRVLLVLFGPQWVGAAPVLTILALAGLLLPLHVINLQVLLAHGGSARFFRIEVAKKLVGVSCVLIGSFHGVLGLAWSQLAASIIAFGLNAAPNDRLLGYGALRQLRDIAGLVLPTAAMIGAIAAIEVAADLPAIIMLAFQVGVGCAVYFMIGMLFRIRVFREGWEIASDLLGARRRRQAT